MSDSVEALAYEIIAKDVVWPKLAVLMAEKDTGKVVYCSKPVSEMLLLTRADARTRTLSSFGFNKEPHGPTRVQCVRANGTTFPVHVQTVEMHVMGHDVLIVLMFDLTGEV